MPPPCQTSTYGSFISFWMLRRSSDMRGAYIRAELQSKVGYARICMFLVSYTLCDFNNPISSQQATVCDVNLINMKFAVRRFCTMKTQTERQPTIYLNQRQRSRIKRMKQHSWTLLIDSLLSPSSASRVFWMRFASMASCKPSVRLGLAPASHWSAFHTAFLWYGSTFG